MQLSRGSAHVLVPATVAFLAVVATAIPCLGATDPRPPPVLQPGDTAFIHGPRQLRRADRQLETAIQTFVDSIPVVLQAYHPPTVIRVKNGNPDSTQRVLARDAVGIDSNHGHHAQKAREIAVQPTTLITVKIRGQRARDI